MASFSLLSFLSLGSRLGPPPAWSPPLCNLATAHATAQAGAMVWFADVGTKVFQESTTPEASCGPTLNVSGARGEHIIFQIAVRATGANALQGVHVDLTFDNLALGNATILRAAFTNVTTPANNITSKGVGMYPDPLLDPADAVIFPGGGGTVAAGQTAAFWVTLPIPAQAPGGSYSGELTVTGTAGHLLQHHVRVRVYDFNIPDAAHASQWTEADPFGNLAGCNTLAEAHRAPKCPPDNHTDFPKYMKPCLETATVDKFFDDMSAHRINRAAWMYDFDFALPIGVQISRDTRSVTLNTSAFDRGFGRLLRSGYRDIRFPTPGCLSGSTCGLRAASGVSPNASWVFGNSSGGWYGNCVTNPTDGNLRAGGCVSGWRSTPLVIPIFENASLNAPSTSNSSLAAWQTQRVGDVVNLNPEFKRLFLLVMAPMAAHMRRKGWINRTIAYVTDEPRWPSYGGGTNFTVNAWVAMARLYRSLDPSMRVQQDLTPQPHDTATWSAVAPLVDAWVWQEGQFQFGVSSGTGAKQRRIERELAQVAKVRDAGAHAYIYNNEVPVIDLPNHRVRTFPWQIWRTNYAYAVSRHRGLQGSLSWYTTTGYFGSDPYKFANVQCEKFPPGGSGSAHPKYPRPGQPTCEVERAAGLWFAVYPPSDDDICHKGPTTSVRWELLRQGLEDVEYFALLDRLAGRADAAHGCGYEDAVLGGAAATLSALDVHDEGSCCASLAVAKKALDAIDHVTWGITSANVNYKPIPGDPKYNQTEDEPYTLDPAVLHAVLDGVARAIEEVQDVCGVYE